jgi:hypothetical protein
MRRFLVPGQAGELVTKGSESSSHGLPVIRETELLITGLVEV